jgi:protein gp37
MAENSGIEWTDHTFNPWIGCTKVSPACDFCYAEALNIRFEGGKNWGPKSPRRRTKSWSGPRKWNRLAGEAGIRQRVFCASLADVFDNHPTVEQAWRDDLWALIRETPNLDWLLLTKRPQFIKKMLPKDWGEEGYSNVWLGTTVENQKYADHRIPHLLSNPAKVHFLSCEPLLGPVDLRGLKTDPGGVYKLDALTGTFGGGPGLSSPSKINWVITGGESGPEFRSADPDWFRGLRDQCANAGVPFLFKQWEGASQKIIKAKGRELDGVIHDGYPMVSA